MVDSLPPSGTDPDNQTIISNSNGKLSVPLEGTFLDVGSSGKVKFFETTQYYLADFEQDSGDWTGIDRIYPDLENGVAKVNVPTESTASASVTADLTDIDELTFRVSAGACLLAIEFDGVELVSIDATSDFVTVEISGLDNYDFGTNTTVTIIGDSPNNMGTFWIDYVRSNPIPESKIIELVDTAGFNAATEAVDQVTDTAYAMAEVDE